MANRCPRCENPDVPYELHPVFVPLQGSARLWRYMSLAKLLSLLGRQELHFARADMLGDPYEGRHSEADWASTEAAAKAAMPDDESREKILQTLRDTMLGDPWARLRKCTYISCWHQSEDELAAMWRVYAGDHGIAIRTTFDDLTKSIIDDALVYAGPVRYIDYAVEGTGFIQANAFNPFLCKRLSFRSDVEVRLITTAHMQEGLGGMETPEELYIRVDLNRLVRDIFVSPEEPKWFANVVEEVVGHYGIPPERVTHSDLYEPI
jgi:hypothetical protein